MTKRLICLFLILCLTLCGCEMDVSEGDVLGAYGSAEEQEEQKSDVIGDITLLYYPDMDTNPVTTTCLANNQLLKLVYRPLIRLDGSFKPECVLAESYSASDNVLTVTIKEGARFSDGSAVTAADAVKSIAVAQKNASSPYYNSVSLISKCTAVDERTLTVTFKTADIDAAGVLDIPVMKDGQEGIGSGPYKLSEQNGKLILEANEYYFEQPSVEVLHLTETKTDEYITTLFSAGELDVLSIPGNDDLSLTSLRNYTTLTYSSNNLIYIGVNTNNELFADAAVRRALSSCIDREKLASQTLVGLAEPTVYPFNPGWYKLDIYGVDPNPEASADTAPLADKKLKLLVSEDSQVKSIIAKALEESFGSLGLTLELELVSGDEYVSRVKSGDFDLYLGETAIPKTMDPTYLYGTGGSMNYCGYSNAGLDSAFAQYKATGTGIDKYLEMFSQQMPVIPIIFRKNAMYSTEILEGYTGQSAWDSYGKFERVTRGM